MNDVLEETDSSIWEDIKASLAGNDLDFTSGSIGRAILILSVPMVLEMMMESVFAVVDIFFVSKLGANAVAAVGITESLLTIVYAIGIGFSMATTAIVSRRTGEKDADSAARAAVQSIIVGFLASFPIALTGILFAPELLSLMGAEAEIVEDLYSYTAIMLGGNVVIMLLFVINSIFRGVGDAAISMRVLWLANGFNIIFDPILIFGLGPFPELGITGAAIATTTGRGLAVVYQFYKLFEDHGRIRLLKKHLVIQLDIIKKLVRVSLGGIGQFLIATSSWIGLVRIIAEFGSIALAGYTIGIRIFIFSILPSWGMSNAAATLVGQNLGAKKPDRAEKSTWITAGINMLFLGLVGIIFIIYAEQAILLFTNEAAVVDVGAQCLRIISYGYLAYAFGMVIIQAFNGSGDTVTPTMINFFCFWVLEIPLAYFLAITLGWNEEGVFYSIIIAESVLAVIGFILFKRGNWKTTEV
ncbi:MAG: MATE family efflux transporter [Balneolaceae bacterium]|nr:MATE family efflux transporter [Balneolaceae bacterium]